MSIDSLLRKLPDPVLRRVAAFISDVPLLRRWVSKRSINRYANAVPPRPRAISMASDYSAWHGLTDRRWSGRHLAAASGASAAAEPDIDRVAALFERRTERLARDTSLLFPFFAQWFVDSFLRTKWEAGPERHFRENESNHEIDLCQIYGATERQTAMLREGAGGRLRAQTINGEEWPAPLFEEANGSPVLAERYRRQPEQGDVEAVPGLYTTANFARVSGRWHDDDKRAAFAVGLEHGNSTIGNVAMNALFLREHNRTARLLAEAHPDWDDERLFQTARNTTIVVLLNIVIGDYIVHIAPIDVRLEAVPGMAEGERWYRNNWMAVEFALLYRWHDLIPDTFVLNGTRRDSREMLRANRMLVDAGLGQALRDASQQKAGRIGLGNTPQFLMDAQGPDVKRLSLKMARACRLAPFNAYRRHYGLKPVASFEALTGEREMAARLRDLYGSIDRLEWFVGLFAEAYGERDMMGDLLMTMVANDAFTQALTNPLLSSALYTAQTFGAEGLDIIERTRTLADVIARNTAGTRAEDVGFTVRPGLSARVAPIAAPGVATPQRELA